MIEQIQLLMQFLTLGVLAIVMLFILELLNRRK